MVEPAAQICKNKKYLNEGDRLTDESLVTQDLAHRHVNLPSSSPAKRVSVPERVVYVHNLHSIADDDAPLFEDFANLRHELLTASRINDDVNMLDAIFFDKLCKLRRPVG